MGNILADTPRPAVPEEIISARRLIRSTFTCQSLGLQDISEEILTTGDDSVDEETRQRIRSELCIPIAVDMLKINRMYEGLSDHYYYPTYSDRREKVNIDLEEVLKTRGGPSVSNRWRDKPPPSKRNTLVAGAAGSGKSHLFIKIVPFMWANGWLWADMFDLVACFDLCREDVRQANDMAQLLSTYLHDKVLDDGERSAAYFCLPGNERRLCLIFDCLSECVVEDCSEFMRDVLCRCTWCKSSVIVLTRQLADAAIVDQNESYDRFVQVSGLADEATGTFIRRNLPDYQSQLLKNTETPDQMVLPLMALSTSEAIEAGMERPLCLTAAMECSVLLAVEKAGRGRYKSLQEIPDDVYAALSHLSRFALESLMDRRYAFQLAHLEEANLGLPSSRLHLLNPCQEISSLNAAIWFRFSSVSVQEFLSAWYLSTHFLQSSYHAAALVERLDHRTGHLDMLWHYLIATLPRSVAGSITDQIWVKMNKNNKDSYIVPRDGGQVTRELLHESSGVPLCEVEADDLAAAMLAEMQEENRHSHSLYGPERLCRAEVRMRAMASRLLEDKCDPYKTGHNLIVAHISDEQLRDNTIYIKTMMSLWQQRRERSTSTAAHFYEALRTSDEGVAMACRSWLLPGWLVGGAIEELVSKVADFRAMTSLQSRGLIRILEAYYEHCLLHPASGVLWEFRAINKAMENSGLRFRDVALNPHQCSAISFIVASYPYSEISLTLNGCHISNVGLTRLVPALLTRSHLCWLELEKCDITDAELLVPVLRNFKQLEALSLADNCIGDNGFALLALALVEMKHFRIAKFSHTGLTGVSLPLVTRIINAHVEMTDFYLDKNDLLFADDKTEADLLEAVRNAANLIHFRVSYNIAYKAFYEEVDAIEKERSGRM